MNLDQVNAHFEQEAFVYDELILRLIPQYREQNAVVVRMVPFERSKAIRSLDLGCGTGILSYLLLREFPRARVTAFDLAQNMLEVCQNNLKDYADRLQVQQGNFGSDGFGRGYDVIVSGLSIHHLDTPGKQNLYRKIFEALNPGGVFLNREVVLGSTQALTDYYHQVWRDFITANGEDDEHWFAKYLEEDNPATVEEQLAWLQEAGFEDVGCHWRYFNYAVFGGRKPKR